MNDDPKFKKINMVLMVFLTIITLGIYIGYWFLSRSKTFKTYSDNRVLYRWWIVFTVFLSLSFLHTVFGPFLFTPYGVAVMNSFDVVLSFYFMGLLYYSVFRVREMVEDDTKEKIFKPWLLILFHIWYLQFIFNRSKDVRSDYIEPEKAVSE